MDERKLNMRFLILLLAVSVGCIKAKKELSSSNTNNSEFSVELLFEHEGCKVYRFIDGRPHYYTRCGQTISTRLENCGKGCTQEREDMIGENE